MNPSTHLWFRYTNNRPTTFLILMEKLKRRNCLHEVWKDFHNIKCFAHETRNGLWAMNKNLFKHIIHQAIKRQQSWLLVHYYWKIRGLKSVLDKTIIIYDLRLWKWVNSKHNTDGDWTYLDLKTNACPKHQMLIQYV